jgi:hypothetical protein
VLPGHGKNKGSAWERDAGRQLSHWLSKGKRDDLLARNVLSGGQFTVAQNRGKTRGSPGDLTAVDPLAIAFIQAYSVECKRYADLGLDTYIFDKKSTCFLSKTIALCKAQARIANKGWLLIAKQDRKDALIFMEKKIVTAALSSHNGRAPLHRIVHTFHEGTKQEASMLFLDDFLKNVNPEQFTG